MTGRKVTFLLVSAGTLAGLCGCGGGTSNAIPPPVVVVFNPAVAGVLNIGGSTQITAWVDNSTSSNQVMWSLSCGGSACGSLSTSQSASGTPVTYTAPADVPPGATVTVTAAWAGDSSKNAAATITITTPLPITVSFSAPVPASVQVNRAVTLSATVTNDPTTNPQVNWAVSCGGAMCGSLNPTTTSSAGSASYTAPATVPSGGGVTVTATSATDPSKSVTASIVIVAAGPTLANGTYVFQISQSVNSNDSYIAGVIVAQDGAITGGEQDSLYYGINSGANNRIPSGIYPYDQFQIITGGSYASTTDGNVQITIEVGLGVVETIQGAPGPGGEGLIAGLDGAPSSGTLELQTSTAAPAGGYAFSLAGGNDWGTPAQMGGVLNIDTAGGISGNGSILDVYSASDELDGEVSLAASTVSAADPYGRVVFQLIPDTSSTMYPLYLAGYLVDSAHMRLIETGDDSNSSNFQGVLSGTALAQGSSTGSYSAAALAGSSYVFGAAGVDLNNWLQIAGVLTMNAGGSASGTLNWNDQTGTSAQQPLPFTGTYTVDPTGRVTLSNLTDGATFSYSSHLYLATGGGLLVYIPGMYSFSGQAFLRQTGAFTASSLSGGYGLNAVDDNSTMVEPNLGTTSARGSVMLTPGNGVEAVGGYADQGNAAADFAVAGSFATASDGIFTGTLSGFNPGARSTPGNFTLYLVDSTQAVLIETDSAQLVLGNLISLQ